MSDENVSGPGEDANGQQNGALVAAIEALTQEVAALRESIQGIALPTAPRLQSVPDEANVIKLPLAEPPPVERVSTDRHWGKVESVLTGVFLAALDEDDDAGFDAFLTLMHTDRTDAPRSIPSLREFSWKNMKKKLDKYLMAPTEATSFEIARRVPETLGPDDRNAKVFLASPDRSPVPISFRRDPNADDAWRVTDTSL